MWWITAALAADGTLDEPVPPSGHRSARAGHALSIVGEIVALAATPLLAAGTTGATFSAIEDPVQPLESPWNALMYTGLALAGVGAPLTIAGAELEASGRKAMGQTVSSHGDVAAWASFGVAVSLLTVAIPVASTVGQDHPSARPIVVGSAGLVSTTLWFCSLGLGAGFRGSQREAGALSVTFVPSPQGGAIAMRW